MSKSKTAKTTWDRYAIAAEIKRRGSTLVAIAEGADLERSACSVALLRPHAAGERAISDFLGVPLSVLWPSRYPTLVSNPASASPASPIGGGV